MEDKLKIKISIADRVYPLTIQPSQEEGLRKAVKACRVPLPGERILDQLVSPKLDFKEFNPKHS